MNGYFFVLIEYSDGRFCVVEQRFKNEDLAHRSAEQQKKKLAKSARRVSVHYQYGIGDVDVKQYV